jgi:hypothetical protein
MSKICYIEKNFRPASVALIAQSNTILDDMRARGYQLTLRQLYYQLVAAAIIPNTPKSYDNLGALINDARLAGLVDWNAIEDRTRNLQSQAAWNSPGELIERVEDAYHKDWWRGQKTRVEVWIEKDALVGVIEGPCTELDCPFFSCRGYTSQSEMWGAAHRIMKRQMLTKQLTTILHLGDHDPSGIDMTRDITERLAMFCHHHGYTAPIVKRIALTMDQIEEYNPPPNPAKISDSRATGYIDEYGDQSWELDALTPEVIEQLIRDNVEPFIDDDIMDEIKEQETKDKELLGKTSERWDEVAEFLEAE